MNKVIITDDTCSYALQANGEGLCQCGDTLPAPAMARAIARSQANQETAQEKKDRLFKAAIEHAKFLKDCAHDRTLNSSSLEEHDLMRQEYNSASCLLDAVTELEQTQGE